MKQHHKTNQTSHYFSQKQYSSHEKKEIHFRFKEHMLHFNTSHGVFSKDHVDPGTRILIENAQIPKAGTILDLGCGYGPIAISLKKAQNENKELHFFASDVNERAVKLTTENAKKNQVEITVIQSSLFENIPQQFDSIIINIPTHAGKELCFAMIEQSFQHLNKEGTLQIVARHQKGGASFEKKMNEVFGNVKAIAKESGYRVYLSKKI